MTTVTRTAVAMAIVFGLVAGIAAWSTPGQAVQNPHLSLEDIVAPETRMVPHGINADQQAALRCMALNIYFEARSEPLDGQIAVAAVTLNRMVDSRFPDDICSVVRQGGEIRRHRCQFSWWCDGKKDEPLEAAAWHRANMLARLAYAGILDDPTQGALWYHADYVDPFWADAKVPLIKIGRHIFYNLPPRENTQVSKAESSGPVIR